MISALLGLELFIWALAGLPVSSVFAKQPSITNCTLLNWTTGGEVEPVRHRRVMSVRLPAEDYDFIFRDECKQAFLLKFTYNDKPILEIRAKRGK